MAGAYCLKGDRRAAARAVWPDLESAAVRGSLARRWRAGARPNPFTLALLAILVLAAVLRLWGIEYGLPFGYQMDEERLYVPQAVGMLANGTFDPDYFQNPASYTYLVRELFAIRFDGDQVDQMLAAVPDRGDLFLTARLATAFIGIAAVWLVYLIGTRFFDDRRIGLLSALLMAVAFLPVFYSHVALNNVPAMAATCVSLVGTAGIVRWGRRRDYVLAGIGVGLAAATKYINGVVLAPLLLALWLRPGLDLGARLRKTGFVLVLAAVTFVLLNPYALLSFSDFIDELRLQESAVERLKIGVDEDAGIPYYLFTFVWGLGAIPAFAAVGGAVLLFYEDRRLFWILVPIVPAFVVFMGLNAQYFARWMLPMFPIVCILAGYAGIRLIELIADRRPAFGGAAVAIVALALCAQSVVYVIHNDRVLSRPHTFNLAREWMLEHIPRRAKVVIEPKHHDYWQAPWPRSSQALFDRQGREIVPHLYAPHLVPRLVPLYERKGFCWVQVSSDYWGPALKDESGQTEGAREYYRALADHGRVVFSASPYGSVEDRVAPGRDEVEYNQDWAFNFYPLAYARPGPAVLIYRLENGVCA
jgi:hypothetical protein